LSPETRARIALEAFQNQGVWGAMTQLAQRYRVSRQFIYLLLWSVTAVFKPDFSTFESEADDDDGKKIEVSYMRLLLSLKLQGHCSVGDISQIFKTLGTSNNSIGYVSQQLHAFAAALPRESPGSAYTIVVLADETFSNRRPILVVLEARSHYLLKAILAPDRSGETWRKVFEALKAEGYDIEYSVADLAKGLCNGAELAGLGHFPDLMHLLQPFAPFLSRFERRVQKAIKDRIERERVLESARSERVLEKRFLQCEAAAEEVLRTCRERDAYAYLWGELRSAFDAFNPDGTMRTRQVVEGDIEAILDLMKSEFDDPNLHAAVKTLRTAMESYWSYFERLKTIVEDLSMQMPEDVLRELCLAWQTEKKSRSAKDHGRKKALQREAEDHRFLASCGDIKDATSLANLVFDRLESNVRSSSPLESINSRIRDYLNNCRGQIDQEMLDLIVYFLNHKVASRGVYQGTSAWERFTGQPEQGTYADQIVQYLTAVQ